MEKLILTGYTLCNWFTAYRWDSRLQQYDLRDAESYNALMYSYALEIMAYEETR